MKKITAILICTMALVLVFTGCSKSGNVSDVKTKEVASKLYTDEDISKAIDTIKEEFKSWKGCKLKEIYYAGDKESADCQEWAKRHNADEVLVLLSSFDVGPSGGNGSLNANSTYDNWKWILVREKGGNWQHVDHGF